MCCFLLAAALGSLLGCLYLWLDGKRKGIAVDWRALIVFGLLSFLLTIGITGHLCRFGH